MPHRMVLVSVILVAAAAALTAIGLWVRVDGVVPFQPKAYTASVRFPDGTGLVKNADVRISGVTVGRVVRVTPVGAATDAELEIEPRFAPLPADTRTLLRSKSLLGERFVALSPGTASGPKIAEGGHLDSALVSATPTVGDVLDALDPPTRKAIRRLSRTLQVTLRGHGAELNQLLGGIGPTTRDLERLTAIVDRQRPLVARLLRRSDTVLAAVADSGRDLDGIVRDASGIVADSARRTAPLRQTVDGLPALMAETRRTLAVAERLTRQAAPTVARLRAAAPVLPGALDSANRLVPAMARLLQQTRPALRKLKRVLPETEAVVGQLPALLPAVRDVTRQMPGFFGILAAYREQLVGWAAKLGGMTQTTIRGADGRRQHIIRLAGLVANNSFFGLSDRQPTFRGTPYPAPGALNLLAQGNLPAFDCRNSTRPATFPSLGGAPSCVLQAPWAFAGAKRSYPHVEPLADSPPAARRER
jgi:virulence factor Mce-like protein